MSTRRRFCSCRLWRLQQPCDERLCFDEASRRRRRRHGRSRTDEACEELRVLSIDSPTLYGALESSSQGHFCTLTFELSGDRRLGAAAKLGKMGRSPSPAWATCQAVGRPLERGVRRRRGTAACYARLASGKWVMWSLLASSSPSRTCAGMPRPR